MQLSSCFSVRSQDHRKERRAIREAGLAAAAAAAAANTVKEPEPIQEPEEIFDVDEYKEMAGKGSFDTGDPLTTNLYVGNINPKVRIYPS